jgi:hypothetical protein
MFLALMVRRELEEFQAREGHLFDNKSKYNAASEAAKENTC